MESLGQVIWRLRDSEADLLDWTSTSVCPLSFCLLLSLICSDVYLWLCMQILQIRAETENIQVEEESLQQLGAIGVRTTLRSVCVCVCIGVWTTLTSLCVHWCLNYSHVFVCVCIGVWTTLRSVCVCISAWTTLTSVCVCISAWTTLSSLCVCVHWCLNYPHVCVCVH